MTLPLSATSAAGAGEILLPLSDPAHLYNAPPIAPLSSSPVEVLGISGIEYLLSLLHMSKKRQAAHTLVLLLPTAQAAASLDQTATEALHHYAQTRIIRDTREMRLTYYYGWRVTAVAMLVLIVCLALSSFFASEAAEPIRPLIRHTLEYGFEIVGWVMLWHPIDVLVFSPIPIRHRMKALRTLARMQVAIRSDQAGAPHG